MRRNAYHLFSVDLKKWAGKSETMSAVLVLGLDGALNYTAVWSTESFHIQTYCGVSMS